MNKRRRIERLEAASGGGRHQTPNMALEVYLKFITDTPLTPEEQAWEEATNKIPEMREYFQELEQQREAQLRRENLQEGVNAWHERI